MTDKQTELNAGIETGNKSKWHVLFGSFASYAFDALDFMLLAMALPVIIKELNISMAKGGLLGTATLIGVGISAVVLGWLSDNYGRKKALITSVLIFGVFTGLVAFANSWEQILIFRFLAGLGLGGVWGVAAALIAESWPAAQRARAASFVLSAWPVGFGFAAYVSSIILPRYGWRALFAFGFIAVIVVVYIALFVPESEVWKEHKKKAAEQHGGKHRVSVGELFSPELAKFTILGTLMATCTLIAYWGVNTWLPTYLVKERGLNVARMGQFVVMLNVGMFIGYQVFAYLADVIGRKKVLIITFLGAAMMLPIYVMVGDNEVLFWLGPILALFYAFFGIFGSYFAELFPARVRSMGSGFCFNMGRGISAFAPFVLGFIASKYSLATGIGFSAVMYVLAAVTIMFLPETGKSK